MRLLTFWEDGINYFGIQIEEGVLKLQEALASKPSSVIPNDYNEIIAGGEKTLRDIKKYINSLKDKEEFIINEKEIKWGPAVPAPHKIICVGLNYRRHADETNSPYPEAPILFSKFDNTLTSHQAEISIPKETEKMDYEVELAIVIGKEAKNVPEEEALDYVFGYCTANDLSARDLQMKTPQWLLGKTCDDFSPLGPYLIPAKEVNNPQNLNLRTFVNGEIRQDSNTSDMIFSCKEIVSYISNYMTLVPGDVILTGTPEGVILGMDEKDQNWLKSGDVVTVEIENIGSLTNTLT